MPIYRDKDRGCFVFEFDRRINKKRVRARKHLPKNWSRAQADKFDRQESERLYGIAAGVIRREHTIDEAVAVYLKDKKKIKSFKATAEHLAAVMWAYQGATIESLPEVAAKIREKCQHLADATVKNRIACLRAACRWAWKKHNMAESDPAARLQVPRVRNERHVYIELAHLYKALRGAKNPEARKAMVAAFYTGMRLGELMRSKQAADRLVVLDVKNGEAIKSVPMAPALVRYLERRGGWPPKCAYKTVQKWQRIGMDKAGLRHVTFHDLRHSTASALINSGADLYVVGQVLGHKDPRSTQRYAHLKDEMKLVALSRIGQKVA
jgi:integrase